jgi:hypothetical protein
MRLMGGPGLDRFTAICKAVRASGRRLAMAELTAAADLAIELDKETPDQGQVEKLRRTLGIETLEGLG